MLGEAVAAVLLGAAVLWLALRPLLAPPAPPPPEEPPPLEETPRGRALLALKEIEFDRATGKLSEGDYQALNAKYTAQAVAVLRAEAARVPDDGFGVPGGPGDAEALIAARLRVLRGEDEPAAAPGAWGPEAPARGPACLTCGPRPETDARFCSSCGTLLLAPAACGACGAPLEAAARFCADCGAVTGRR
jgi:hypothetical protein